MPHEYTVSDQVKFLAEWFDSWSELQKEDFLPILVQALNPADHLNGLVGVTSLNVSGSRRPSLFDCQVKLFHDWFEIWTPTERAQLLDHISDSDPEFRAQLNKSLPQSDRREILPSSPIERPDPNPSQLPVTVNVENDKDDHAAPASPASSPLSSLSQPVSPHDSGLDDNHSDLEACNSPPCPSIDSRQATSQILKVGSDSQEVNVADNPPVQLSLNIEPESIAIVTSH